MKKLVISTLLSMTSIHASAFDLADYSLTATYLLPAVAASEASAVSWNWNTDTLFVLGDEGDTLVEVSKTGVQISSMTLTGFDDTEGLTYIGGGKFIITEERLQDAYLLTYSAGGSVARSSLASLSLGATVGNIGIEGISYDRASGDYIAVKEKSPQAVYDVSMNFAANTISVTSLFSPSLSVADLSDVQTLSNYTALLGTSEQDNLLIYSQESARLMEVDRAGNVLSSLDFSKVAGDIEGVTIDANGTIYLVGETPALYVLTSSIPEPETLALMLGGLGLLAGLRRHSTV